MTPELAAQLDEVLALGWTADQVAFKTRNAALASWVKYLDKAKEKLPTWVAARCWIDERSYIQSSSEGTATAKFDGLSGGLAIDLTMGLGVDTAALAARFDRVVGVEADPNKAEAARFNFARLGIDNIEVVCAQAEEIALERADLVYIDPSRIDAAGKKVYSLEQSSPNVLSMLDRLPNKTIIKLSPLFDVAEAERLLGGAVEVVSVDGECKEVLVRLGEQPERRCTIINKNGVRRLNFLAPHVPCPTSHVPRPTYLYVPDVAIVKARVVGRYMERYAEPYGIEQNIVFSSEKLEPFDGQCFVVERIAPYKPKELKKELAGGRFELHLGNGFPLSIDQITKQLAIRAGGEQRLFFCTISGETVSLFVSLCR